MGIVLMEMKIKPGSSEKSSPTSEAAANAARSFGDPAADTVRPFGDPAAARGRLDIRGMSCAACVANVERALLAVPGAYTASVDLLGHRADVQWDGAAATAQDFVAAVSRAGYPATLQNPLTSFAQRNAEKRATAHREMRSLFVRFVLTSAVALLAMALSMPLMHSAPRGAFSAGHIRWALLLLTLPVITIFGRHFFIEGWRALARGSADMNTLIALGAGSAFVHGALITLFPDTVVRFGLPLDVYFEAIPGVIALVTLGKVLEERAKHRAGEAVLQLASGIPATARVIRPSGEEDVPWESVAVGDLLRIRPGEAIPVDSVVVSGTATVDESMLTGESLPRTRGPGDELAGGARNVEGSVVARASAIGAESALARIVQLLEAAMAAKPPLQRLVDRVAAWFVPAVLIVAGSAALVWAVWGPAPQLSFAAHAWITTLVIACPCAMGLAVPAAIAVATGAAARQGILIRSGQVLETAHAVDTFVFDKTGTLTLGEPRIAKMQLVDDSWAGRDRELAELCAAVERGSGHPLARAVFAFAEEHRKGGAAPLEKLPSSEATDWENRTGRGVAGRVADRWVLVGTARFLDEEDVEIASGNSAAREFESRGSAPLFVAVDGKVVAVLEVEDALRPGAKEVIAELRQRGCRIILLTGDRQPVAEKVARELGISEVIAEALPWDKVEAIQKLRSEGRRVAFVGDGVNDAPAIAAAELGIALSHGAHVANDSADLTLLGSNLVGLPRTLRLASRTRRVLIQNLAWAFGYNVLGIPLAAGALYPWTGWLLSPLAASAAMALSSVSVVANSLRLRRAAS